ncbi:MAG: hypothetical protein ACRC0B_01475 [Legionella sp.]
MNCQQTLGCPLKINEYPVGVFCLIDDKPRLINAQDHNIIYDLTQMVEVDLESLQTAITDDLTGLSNNRV